MVFERRDVCTRLVSYALGHVLPITEANARVYLHVSPVSVSDVDSHPDGIIVQDILIPDITRLHGPVEAVIITTNKWKDRVFSYRPRAISRVLLSGIATMVIVALIVSAGFC